MSLLRFQSNNMSKLNFSFSSFLSVREYANISFTFWTWLRLSRPKLLETAPESASEVAMNQNSISLSFSMPWLNHTVMTVNAIIIRIEIVRARLANGHTRNELSDPWTVRSLTKTTLFQSYHNWIKLCRNLISDLKLRKDLAIRMISSLQFLHSPW